MTGHAKIAASLGHVRSMYVKNRRSMSHLNGKHFGWDKEASASLDAPSIIDFVLSVLIVHGIPCRRCHTCMPAV